MDKRERDSVALEEVACKYRTIYRQIKRHKAAKSKAQTETSMNIASNYQKLERVRVSWQVVLHSLTAMHAWTGNTLSAHIPVHSVPPYPPLRHTHGPQLPQGVTVCSGGSETTRRVGMQTIKGDEFLAVSDAL